MKITTNSAQTFQKSFPGIRVDSGLIRGKAISNPYKLYQLKKIGVNQIIDLRNTSYIKIPMERFFCKLLGLKYFNYKYSYKKAQLPTDDFFKKINDTIVSNEGITYMHCQKGKRRTGICVAFYEKEHTNKTKDTIIEELYNLGFKELMYPSSKNFFGIKKYKKLYNMFNEFINKYYPENADLKDIALK